MNRRAETTATRKGQPTPAGLLEKLMAAVRTEFRSDVLVFEITDPIFGGSPCQVSGCGRVSHARGLCEGHRQRWVARGRPDIDQFAAATGPTRCAQDPLPACRVPGCDYGVLGKGMCPAHYHAWRVADGPEFDQWLVSTAAPVAAADPPRPCRLRSCPLWAHPSATLCHVHNRRWMGQGRPDLARFVQTYDRPADVRPRIDLQALSPHLRLEVQYALQRRRDDNKTRTDPDAVRATVRFLASMPALTSMLDHSESRWREHLATRGRKSDSERALVIYARRQVEDLAHGVGWEVEYPRGVWRLHKLGVEGPNAHLRFDRIPQPWLGDLAKRWIRWNLGSGLSGAQAYLHLTVVTRFALFLADRHVRVDRLALVDRALLERYLAQLRTDLGGTSGHGRHITILSGFFQAIRRHNWDDSLPTSAMFFNEDVPRQPQRLPRALAEHVMTQVEDPANLNRWDDPNRRLVTLILIRCGLRVTDATTLPHDCLVHDADGAPYLRYYNHKMKREALVPIDDELHQMIISHQRWALQRWPSGKPVLFPRPHANLEGIHPIGTSTYRAALRRWLERCDIRDEHGRPVHLTPHQWRHTLGTRLINRDVPQHVVQKILDHDSAEMTAHYARLSDTTVRRHWEQARKVNVGGQTVSYDPAGQLSDAVWAKQRLSRATQALPNGHCGLPLARSCPHANSCLTCPMFLTTAEFLPQHRQQYQQTLQLISSAEARGQGRMVEMNRQVADNLQKIITALEADHDEHGQVADAS